MRDDEQTMYINGDNTKESKGESTVYIGGQQERDSDDQTVYIGSDNVTLKEDIQSRDIIQIISEESETIIDRRVEENANFSEPLYYLPTNTMLQKRYRINTVLGEGGFGITYSGWDVTLNIPVAIKEYYPSGLVTRNATLGKTTQVVPVASAKYGTQFRDGIDRVLDEARRMAKFRNTPGIVGIYDFFEANNTAYIVMEYVSGYTLDKYCKNNRVDNTTLFNMLVPVMDALQALHSEGMIHRDISPDNIMVDDDGNFKLLDFGAARGYSEESATTMSVILKKSYAPEEQFRSRGVQGPWTDVYALGATIYELITERTPPASIDRLAEDEIVEIKVLAPSLTKSQSDAIMTALAVRQKDRWQSVTEFKNALLRNPSNLIKNNLEHAIKDNINIGQKESENNIFDKISVALRKIPKKIYGIGIGILVLVIVVISITKSLGHKEPGYLGINAENIPSSISMQYDVSEGAYITGIYADSPASRSSLDAGDIIVKINSTNIVNQKDFNDLMRELNEGNKIKIEFLHLENGEYIERNESIKLGNKNEQSTIGALVNSTDPVSMDNAESYVSTDGIIQAHLQTVSHNLSSYFAYIEFTNETDKDVIIKSKDIYLNGIPTDTSGKRKLGIVPANSTIILSSYISLDVLINEGIADIDSFEILFYLGDNDSALYRIAENDLSITIDYTDEDLEKVNSNKSVGASDVVATKNDDVDIVEAPKTETKVSITGNDAANLEPWNEESTDTYGTLDGNISNKLKIKFRNLEEKNSYISFIFLIENKTEEDFGIKFWYESNINDYTLSMRSTSELSSNIVPAGGTTIMTIKYSMNELQYCGISTVEKLRFYVGEAGVDRSEATEVTFKDLGIKIKESLITENAINNRISGELSVNELNEGISIDYVGYETSGSYICLYFDVKNTSENYYGFAFWYASQVNKCAIKMKNTSEVSGALDGNDHVLLAVKYTPDDLRNAGISNIDEVIFNFADNLDNKANAATATFNNLNIPVE